VTAAATFVVIISALSFAAPTQIRGTFVARSNSCLAGTLLILVLLGAAPVLAADRVALVIGNGLYQKVPTLPNPPRDAADIGKALERLNFKVTQLSNASATEMRKAIVDFGHTAEGSEMAVVFYAGHGMEAGGENWLIPTDAELRVDTDVESEAISLRSINLQVSKARQLGLVILDACRNNPFAAKMQRSLRTRAVARGLAPTEPTDNVLVAYAARDGTTANDGDGRNSPFTAALLRNIETPGLEISFLFRNVRDEVMTATKREQQPFVYGSLSKEAIYLNPRSTSTAPESSTPTVAPPATTLTPADQASQNAPKSEPVTSADLPRLLLAELRRVGCSRGINDDNWNIGAQRSLRLFNENAKTAFEVQVASLDALNAVRRRRDRVCPLICERGYKADGDKCVAVVCKVGFRVGDNNTCEKEKVEPQKPTANREPKERQGTPSEAPEKPKPPGPKVALEGDSRCSKMHDKLGCLCAVQNGGGISADGRSWYSKRGGRSAATNEAFVQCQIRAGRR
jgi:hypothetical protein